jgi:hypothetical protein
MQVRQSGERVESELCPQDTTCSAVRVDFPEKQLLLPLSPFLVTCPTPIIPVSLTFRNCLNANLAELSHWDAPAASQMVTENRGMGIS